MTASGNRDWGEAHRFFSVECFNRAWDYLEQEGLSPAEGDEMVHLAVSSLWHWTRRPECADENRSIGHWQVSRAFSFLGLGEAARHYALRCQHFSQDLSPFYQGYALEALARAEQVAGNQDTFREYLGRLRETLPKVEDEANRQLLESDFQSLGGEA